MTARTTGPGRTPGSGGTPKRPAKRPATGRPAGAKTAKDNPAGLTVVDGTAALAAVEADDVAPVIEAVEADAHVDADVDADAPVDGEPAPEPEADPAAETDVVIDLTAVEAVEAAEAVEAVEAIEAAERADDEAAPLTDPAGVPPIDAGVLLRAILAPPAGIANGESLTDALTGAVPTWRLDEEPIYLETIRDLGVPAVPEADGGTGEVIVGEIVEQEA